MLRPIRVLIIEDSPEDSNLLLYELRRGGYEPASERVETSESMEIMLATRPWDVILSDYVLPHFDGMAALAIARAKAPDVPFILVSGAVGEETAVGAMKAGAEDYVMKGNLKRLVPAIERGMREAEIQKEKRKAEEALQESEERYRSLFDSSLEMVQSVGPDGRFLMVNQTWLTSLGYTREEIVGLTVFDTVAPDHREACRKVFSMVLAGGSVKNIQAIFISKTGKRKWLEGNVTPRVIDGRVIATHGIFRDITQRRLAEEALRESEAKYAALVEHCNDGIIFICDGHLEFVNERLASITGLSPKEFIGKPFIDLVVPAEREMVAERYRRRMIGEDTPNNYEIHIIGKDGKIIPVEINASLIEYKGKIADMAVVRDISERKKADEEILRSQKQLQEIMDGSPGIIFVKDPEGKFITINHKLELLLGVTREEVRGKTEYELITRSGADNFLKNDREVLLSGISQQFEEEADFGPSGHFTFLANKFPLLDENGKAYAVCSISNDITERKHMEDALKESEILYRSLFENMLNGFAYCKMIFEDGKPRDFIYINVNSAFENLTGLKNVAGKKVTEVIPGIRESDPQLFEIFGRVALTGVPEKLETYVSGLDMWFSISVYSPKKEYFVAVFDVITERKKAEAALKASEEKFRNLVENAPVGIGITSLDGSPLFRNKAQALMLGYGSVEELMSTPVTTRYYYPEDRKKFVAQASAGPVRNFEVLMKRRDGSPLWTSLTAIPQTGENGEEQFITIMQDIDDWKRTEEELKRKYETEGILNRLLNLSLDKSPLNEVMEKALRSVLSTSWLSLEAKGTIFITDNTRDTLVMAAHIGLSQPVIDECRRIPFGKCICGLAASRQELYFCENIDDHHEVRYQDIAPHGHYCVPVLYESRTIGVINTYVKAGHERSRQEELFLGDVANVLAGVIVRRQAEDALKYSEEKFRSLVENAPAGITVTTMNGRRIEANRVMIEMHRYPSKEDFLSDSIINSYDDPDERKMFMGLLAQGPVQNFEMHRKRKDGTVFWASLSSTTFMAASGEKQIINVVEDISIRKGVEQALKISEEKYRTLIENLPVGISITSPEGSAIQRNQALVEMYGCRSKEELSLLPTLSRYHDPKDREHLLELSKKGRVRNFETRFKRQDCSLFWVNINSITQVTPSGDVLLINVIQDIDARKKAESENELKAMLLDSAGDMIYLHDRNGKILYANDAACKTHGYTREELIKMNVRDLLAPDRADSYSPLARENIELGDIHFETQHRCKDGKLIPVEVYNRVIKLGDDPAFISIGRDITERKKMDEQLMVTSRLASIGELASGVAHEINNPLTSVIGFSSLLLERPLPEDIKEDLGVVLSEAERAARVVRNLLTFARKHAPSREPVDVNAVIGKILEIRTYEQTANNIKVAKDLAVDIPKIAADFYQLQQVFFNLVVNAEYFMAEAHRGGTLTLTTMLIGDSVRITVGDDGPGISEENMKHLFNPFFTTKPVGKGTGLGLSICHGIIAEHGGTIRVESTPGAGTIFIVDLPIAVR